MYSKGNHKEDGKTTLRMGVIFVNEVIGKGLISKIYNNLMQLHIKKKQKKKKKKKQQQQVTQSKMGGRPKQIFLQIKHTHGQQTHEKMLNISHY